MYALTVQVWRVWRDSRQLVFILNCVATARPVLGGNSSSEVKLNMVGADMNGGKIVMIVFFLLLCQLWPV